jgi:hypothetical protein
VIWDFGGDGGEERRGEESAVGWFLFWVLSSYSYLVFIFWVFLHGKSQAWCGACLLACWRRRFCSVYRVRLF